MLYQEAHRPQFHFSPPTNWMNDPNGLVFWEGEYHLFYQYHPNSSVWGPMHWGHAVSQDLVHWEHLPIALFPDTLGNIYSGSAVVDHNNTSGLGKKGEVPLIAIFTHHDSEGEKAGKSDFQFQSIAYSLDKGRSWTKYHGNPVLSNPGFKDFRDPKVFWHESSQKWVMVLAVYDRIHLYTSPNLLDWIFASEFGIPGDDRVWECPDLFPLKVEGTTEKKWVLIVSIQHKAPNGGTATAYFVGEFDGKTFYEDPNQLQWADYGTDNYAMVSWSDIPASDGRRLAIGWMSNWEYGQVVPTKTWRSAMTLPRELTLKKNDSSYLLCSNPIKELDDLVDTMIPLDSISRMYHAGDSTTYKLEVEFPKPVQGFVGVKLSNRQGEFVTVEYHVEKQQYIIDRTHSGNTDFHDQFAGKHIGQASYQHQTVQMNLYVDHSSIELFADGGKCVMTEIVFPSQPLSKVDMISSQKELTSQKGQLTSLNSIW